MPVVSTAVMAVGGESRIATNEERRERREGRMGFFIPFISVNNIIVDSGMCRRLSSQLMVYEQM